MAGVGVMMTALTATYAQDAKKDETKPEGLRFTTVKELKITPIKNQHRTGTCWSFSGVGFIESELLRTGKGEVDLSEMFIVNHSYKDKADKYVRLHGMLNFAQGGSFYDVLYAFKHYGAMPNELYTGLQYGEDSHVHNELAEIATGYVKAIVGNKNGKLSPVWKQGYDALIDAYLGKIPEKFTYKGKQYTPKSYGESLGLNFDDYVSLTSFTHHPFYTQFALEIEDNWRWSESYNLPINELMEVIDHAVNSGYTLAWGTDVSEKGFTRDGIGIAADVQALETSGSDQARWVGLSRSAKDEELRKMIEAPGCKEIKVTQELRQKAYDNYQTTDDHGMLIYGIARDQTGRKYYMVKNSWGTDTKYKGIWYVTEAFVAYKTINVAVHKDALPKALRAKLGIK